MIKEAKIFKNGQSQAVRLPKEFRFDAKAVYINKLGNNLILIPQDDPWRGMVEACDQFTEDFMTKREDLTLEERDWPE